MVWNKRHFDFCSLKVTKKIGKSRLSQHMWALRDMVSRQLLHLGMSILGPALAIHGHF